MMEQNFFKKRREELSLTQLEIAIALEITPSTVGAWERGENPPRLKNADKIAQVYKANVKRVTDAIVQMSQGLTTAK